MNLILSSHPLSKGYMDQVMERLGPDTETLTLSEIKRHSVLGILKIFRGKRGAKIYLAFEDDSVAITQPTMEILALLAGAKKIYRVSPELQITPIPRWKTLKEILKYPVYSALGFIDLFFFTVTVIFLNRLKRDDSYRFSSKEILYIKSNLWFGIKGGGSVGHVAGVINGFLKKGWSTYFFSIEKPQMVESSLKFFETPFPRPYVYPPDINNITYHHVLARAVRKMGQRLRFKGIVYQRMSIFNFSGVIVSRALKRPLVLEYNGSEVWISKNWGKPPLWSKLAETAEMICLKHAHRIVTVSDVLKDELVEKGIEAERIVVYPNCIDPEVYDNERFDQKQLTDIRRQYGLDPDDFVFTFVGTFGLWHGVDVLAEAIKKLVDTNSELLRTNRVKFLLVGDGYMMPEVKASIGSEPYSEFVAFTGLIPQDEGPGVMSASDLLLSPHKPNKDGSRFFGSPTKLVEYMGVRKPVIASSLEQIAQTLEPSFNPKQTNGANSLEDVVGILVEPGNSDDLIEAIVFAIHNKQEVHDLGIRARDKVINNYTWNHHVMAIVDSLNPFVGPIPETQKLSVASEIWGTPYYLIGPLPPPLGGVSIYVQRYSKRLRSHLNVIHGDLKKLGYIKSLAFLLKMIWWPKPSVVHINSGNLVVLAMLFLRPFPIYVRVQDHSERKLEKYNFMQRFLLNLFLKRVDELILVGDHLKEYYVQYGITLPKKVRIKLTFLPPDPAEEAPIWETYSPEMRSFIQKKSPLLVINAYKITYYNGIDLYGLDMALDLVYRLKDDYPNLGLLIALADPSDHMHVERLKKQIQDQDLGDNIHFLTNQRVLWPIFRQTDIMIRPTVSDGFGVSVAEAVYLGCQAIASDVCARPKGTILFKSRDMDDFEQKVRVTLEELTLKPKSGKILGELLIETQTM
jgi:glycosyltransferase involved in cell wall biosynthesis